MSCSTREATEGIYIPRLIGQNAVKEILILRISKWVDFPPGEVDPLSVAL